MLEVTGVFSIRGDLRGGLGDGKKSIGEGSGVVEVEGVRVGIGDVGGVGVNVSSMLEGIGAGSAHSSECWVDGC